jgi:hypothetical protein
MKSYSRNSKTNYYTKYYYHRTLSIFFQKRGTPFFADRPPGSSYRPWRIESKGADGIPRQPITSRFVGYPIFLAGRAGEVQRQSRRNADGAKSG